MARRPSNKELFRAFYKGWSQKRFKRDIDIPEHWHDEMKVMVRRGYEEYKPDQFEEIVSAK